MTQRPEHPDWNELAALAESGPEATDPEILAHVAVCPQCMAAIGDAVQSLDEVLADPVPVAPVYRPLIVPVHRRRSNWAWGAGALAAAAVLLVLLMPRNPATFAPEDPRSGLQARLSELSVEGPVYPGVIRLTTAGNAQYRAGGPVTAEADALLAPWQERFAADPADSDAAYWLTVGHLAAGRLHFADETLRRALQRHPHATSLRHLDAITAYRLSDLERAEAALQGLLADQPEDEFARFNQALVLSETGRPAEARAILTSLADDADSDALRTRAQRLLSTLRP